MDIAPGYITEPRHGHPGERKAADSKLWQKPMGCSEISDVGRHGDGRPHWRVGLAIASTGKLVGLSWTVRTGRYAIRGRRERHEVTM